MLQIDKEALEFTINKELWHVKFVDVGNLKLVDRTGVRTVATTNPKTHIVYIVKNLDRDFLRRVLAHEICHCILISYGLTNDIHNFVKSPYWIIAEEWCCNLIADYGSKIYEIVEELMYYGG